MGREELLPKDLKLYKNRMEIPNFPGFYISEEGEVMNPEGLILAQHQDKEKYWRVTLRNKTNRIHRLLALVYLPNPDNLPIVDHINRNRQDNRLQNLRWVGYSDSAENKDVSKKSTTRQQNIYYMKNSNGNYKYVYQKRKSIDGKSKVISRWFNTLEDAIVFRDSL